MMESHHISSGTEFEGTPAAYALRGLLNGAPLPWSPSDVAPAAGHASLALASFRRKSSSCGACALDRSGGRIARVTGQP
jgi:hypothetical protein